MFHAVNQNTLKVRFTWNTLEGEKSHEQLRKNVGKLVQFLLEGAIEFKLDASWHGAYFTIRQQLVDGEVIGNDIVKVQHWLSLQNFENLTS